LFFKETLTNRQSYGSESYGAGIAGGADGQATSEARYSG
jgi:hypothetical protein